MKFSLNLLACLLLASAAFAQQPRAVGEFQISGVVVNAASGEALARTRVQIASTDERARTQGMVTGPNGRFQFQHLAVGKYQLFAQRAGYPNQSFDRHENYSSAIAVGPDKKSTGLVFRMLPEAVISGTILDEANEPVRDAEVILFHRAVEDGHLSTHVTRQVQSDDQGFYHFDQLLEGEFLVVVKARPWYAENMILNSKRQPVNPELDVAFPITFYPGTSDGDSASPIKVRSGDRVSADFVLRAIPAVRLHVRSSSKQFSAHLTQRFFDDYDTFIQTQSTFENENFTISGIAAGQYVLHIDTQDTPDRSQEITVADETTVDAETVANSGAVNLTGIISSDHGLPARMFIQLKGASPRQIFGAAVGSEGKFEMKQVLPGKYEVGVGGEHSYVAQIAAGGARVSGRTLIIGGKSDVTVAIAISQGVGKITGTVLQDDAPKDGVMVLLVPDDPARNVMLYRRDQSDSDGTFVLNDVVPGRYSLMAITDGWDIPYTQSGVVNAYLGKAESVTVAAGGKYDVKVAVQKK